MKHKNLYNRPNCLIKCFMHIAQKLFKKRFAALPNVYGIGRLNCQVVPFTVVIVLTRSSTLRLKAVTLVRFSKSTD